MVLIFNNLTKHRYPHLHTEAKNLHKTNDLAPGERLGFKSEGLDFAINQFNEVLDINRDNLEKLFRQAEMHSYQRRFQAMTCADIMSRDIVRITYETPLEEAWQLLRKHKIKALPVVDDTQKVIGILTLIDFMKHANLDVYQDYEIKLRQLIQSTTELSSGRPQVVGQIMTTSVLTAGIDTHIAFLVPMLSDAGMHHIPIIDEQAKLVGIVTQSDLIAGLFRARLNDAS